MTDTERLAREWFEARRDFLKGADLEKVPNLRDELNRLSSAENALYSHLLNAKE